MFNKRAVKMTFVKDEDTEEFSVKKIDLPTEQIKEVAMFGLKLVAAYIAMDTVRQVMITLAEK